MIKVVQLIGSYGNIIYNIATILSPLQSITIAICMYNMCSTVYVQERIAKAHGSQCGFCTPGIVMSMYTLLRNNVTPSEEEMEKALEGSQKLLAITHATITSYIAIAIMNSSQLCMMHP